MKNGVWAAAMVMALAAGATACGGEDIGERDGPVASVDQAIINGYELNPEGLYYVSVHHGGPGNTSTTLPYNICSGTLIRNDAVLTARHCVTFERSITGTIDAPQHFELLIGSQTSAAREIIDFGDDAALIITERFFTMGGRNIGWRVPIYAGSNSSLVGHELFCAGYGVNSAASDPATADILRYAWIAPSAASSTRLTYNMNSVGQIMFRGDSGGSCIYTGTLGTALEATGINSQCAGASGPCFQVAPSVFRTAANNALSARGPAFVHTAGGANISGHVTTINHPDTNDKPSIVVSATPNWNPSTYNGVYNNHDFGIYYWSGRWRIFNQDFAAMPAGAAFNISVGSGFVHRATTANTFSNSTALDHWALNNNPNAAFIVTPYWNPPGSSGVYNNHPTGVWYDGERWNIFNQDNATMPLGAGFTVRIDRTFSVRASAENLSWNTLYLNDPNLNGHPEAQLFVTPNYNPGGVFSGYLNSAIGVWYDTYRGQWGIFRQDLAAMPNNAGFNVLYRP